ncbi:uridine/cytidine kinase [Ranunculus cassubicifolius]
MENLIDRDQQWLLNCLTATLDTNHEVRSFAEVSLYQASSQPGFGSGLAKVAASKEIQFGLRQLAAVLLKQFIKKHWHEDDDDFVHPIVPTEEKAVIRQLLLMSLDDSHAKICTAIGMSVASIAQYDWPGEWHDFLPVILEMISSQTNMNGVRGALKCMTLLSDNVDDRSVPALIPVLFPCLYTIIISPQIYDKNLRTKALSIVHAYASMLGVMTGVYKDETNSLMLPMIKPWMEQFSIILHTPVQFEDPEDWSIRMEVLKCLMQFVQNFPRHVEAEFSVIEAPLWQTYLSSLKVYESSSIQGTNDPCAGTYDSEGEEKSLEAFIIQLIEFLSTLVGSSRFVKVVARNVKELIYYTVAFMQMTEEQVDTWSSDANQYVADEDDNTYNVRVSGALLLEAVVSSCPEGINAILEASQKRFSESQQEKASGSAVWWRMREAVIFALSFLSEPLEEISGSSRSSFGSFLEQILTEDIATGVHEYPFLHARAFSAVAKFSSLVNPRILEQFMHAAVKAISLDVPAPVKVGACQALSELLRETDKGVIQPHIMDLFSSLMDLLKHASDDTLHLILETLQEAVKAGHEAVITIEPIISPAMLNMWAIHVADPFRTIDIVEVLEAIKNAPQCMWPLVSRVLPSIRPVLEKPQQQPEGLVAGSLDLITMLLKNAPIDIVKTVFDVCFTPVIQIILQSNDHGEMQNATECLTAFVSGGKQEMLAWGPDSGFTMRSLLDAASRLLDPDIESSNSLFVGRYIVQLILYMPSQLAQHMQDLIAALIRRLQSSQTSGLKNSLMLIFARLVHMSSPNVDHLIDLLTRLPVEGYENSLSYVMSEWTKQQGEILGSYQIKVSTSALALLLSTRHPELGKIQVQGHIIQSTKGIVTRSKSKKAPDTYTIVFLPTKILALLADYLVEMQEQQTIIGDDDEDSDWEEVDGDMDHQLLIQSTGALSLGKPTNEHLDAIAKVYNDDEEDGFEDDLFEKADPLDQIKLGKYIPEFLSKFASMDFAYFKHFCQPLTPVQQKTIQSVLPREFWG